MKTMLQLKMNKKAQITVELIIITAVAFILLLYIFNIFNDKIRDANDKKLEFKAREIGDKIANGINSVYFSGDNSKINIVLPNKINNKDYSVNLFPSAHLVEVKWNNFLYTSPIITSNVNNTNIQNKELNLSNLNGRIFIQQ